MADTVIKIPGGKDLKYQGFSKSEEQEFRLAGHDCAIYVYQVDGTANTIPNVFGFQTDLKRVVAGKVLRLSDGGASDPAITVVPHTDGKGKLRITGLDTYDVAKVFIIVAIGSRV